MYDLKTQYHPLKFYWFLLIQIKKHLYNMKREGNFRKKCSTIFWNGSHIEINTMNGSQDSKVKVPINFYKSGIRLELCIIGYVTLST